MHANATAATLETTTAQRGSSWYYSTYFLAEHEQNALHALYTFYCTINAIINATNPQIASTKLAWWQTEIANAFAHKASHPLAIELQTIIHTYKMPRQYFYNFFTAKEQDLHHTRYTTYQDLELYCSNNIGSIAKLSSYICGYSEPATLDFAQNIGIAIQLINNLQHLANNLINNRIYLPLQDLTAMHIDCNNITQATLPDLLTKITPALNNLAGKARSSYHHALCILPAANRYQQLPHLILAKIALALLNKLQIQNWQIQYVTTLSPGYKLWLAWRTMQQERRRQSVYVKHSKIL